MRGPVDSTEQSDRLMMALAEQLKTALVQIGQLAELASDHSSISIVATQALRSIDAYLRSEQQTSLTLEPVSIGAVLYDVAQELSPLAKQCGVLLTIDEPTKTEPVMAHREALHAMITLVGGTLIQSPQHLDQNTEPARVVLGCHRAKGGIVVGAFADHTQVSAANLADTRAIYGRAVQASTQTGLQGAASLVLADKLTTQLQSVLKAYKHSSLHGVGALLLPSKQLQLLI